MTTKLDPKPPIPLTSPDGIVYAYACGQCRHVSMTGTVVRTYDDELVAMMANSSREAAAQCCACRGCGGQVEDRWASFCRCTFGYCDACAPAEIERDRKRQEEVSAMFSGVASPSLCPMCGHPEEERHWEERNRELVRENEVLRSNSDHLSSENASLASQVESMAMRIESLAEELAKPEEVRLREVVDALDGRAVIFDGLGARVGHMLDEMDEWIERAGAAERRLKKAEEVVMLARQLTAYAWEDR